VAYIKLKGRTRRVTWNSISSCCAFSYIRDEAKPELWGEVFFTDIDTILPDLIGSNNAAISFSDAANRNEAALLINKQLSKHEGWRQLHVQVGEDLTVTLSYNPSKGYGSLKKALRVLPRIPTPKEGASFIGLVKNFYRIVTARQPHNKTLPIIDSRWVEFHAWKAAGAYTDHMVRSRPVHVDISTYYSLFSFCGHKGHTSLPWWAIPKRVSFEEQMANVVRVMRRDGARHLFMGDHTDPNTNNPFEGYGMLREMLERQDKGVTHIDVGAKRLYWDVLCPMIGNKVHNNHRVVAAILSFSPLKRVRRRT